MCLSGPAFSNQNDGFRSLYVAPLRQIPNLSGGHLGRLGKIII